MDASFAPFWIIKLDHKDVIHDLVAFFLDLCLLFGPCFLASFRNAGRKREQGTLVAL
jgi:hypothetical protein